MAELTVLMVAEKPSIALNLAEALSPAGASKRKGLSSRSPVYEYSGRFHGRPANFRVTATTGHVYSLDFSQESNDWNKVSPGDLFHAPTVRCYDPSANIPKHIEYEAQGADVLVLWLDCDREGENICFEVIGLAQPQLSQRYSDPQAYMGCIWRAQFSSLAAEDLQQAMENLGHPDLRQSHSVDARQEIDLRLGVAFSRLQTHYFRKHFGSQLGRKMVTYGPCQFPTLWFCVKRHCEIEAFVPTPFWRLSIVAVVAGQPVTCHRQSGEFWNHDEAEASVQALRAAGQGCSIKKARQWRSKISRPLPLNTVAMLRMASDELGLGPGDAMHCAEQLYLKGIMSYPRTETDKYPENFDLEGTVRTLARPEASWARHAAEILQRGLVAPRDDGYDAGDHPPITPVKFTASESQCGSAAGWVLYQAICTHFLSTVSPDCLYEEAELQLDMAGEIFLARSSRCVQKGWMEVDNRDTSDDCEVDLRDFVGAEGTQFPVGDVRLTQDQTRPPGHISESELLGLMEQHGIGTDASMAQHVSNVQKRQYVELDESTRRMMPSALGLALAHAYALVDQGLLLPSVRARIENGCNSIAKGVATKDAVVRRTVRIFEKKFHNFAMRIDRLPMMLAIAYARERNSNLVAGDAAGQGLVMWKEAEQLHQSITLEGLLAEKERVELDEDDGGDIPPAMEALRRVEECTEAVQRVQQALEELGFGSPGPAPQPKGNAKAKAKANPGGEAAQGNRPGNTPAQHAPPAQQDAFQASPVRDSMIARIQSALAQKGGSMDLSELTAISPGIKKKDIQSFGVFQLVPGDNGRCLVTLRGGAASAGFAPPSNGGRVDTRDGGRSGNEGGKGGGRKQQSKGGGKAGGKNGGGKGSADNALNFAERPQYQNQFAALQAQLRQQQQQQQQQLPFQPPQQQQQQRPQLQDNQNSQHQFAQQQRQQQQWQQQMAWQQQYQQQSYGLNGYGQGGWSAQTQQPPWPQQGGYEFMRTTQGNW